MTDGLSIAECDFMELPQKQQMVVLYQNQVETLKIIKSYRFQQKVHYILVSAAIAGVGYLFALHL